jgi:hypothetical protein
MNSSINITAVLRRTFAAYRSRAGVLLALAAFTVVPIEVLSALLGKASPAAAIVALVIDIALIALFASAVIRVTADLRDHARVKNPGELLRAARPVLGQLVLVGVVAGIAIGVLSFAGSLLFLGLTVGAILSGGGLVGAVIVAAVAGTILFSGPGLFLLTIWSVAAPVVVIERPGGLLALPRSQKLVRGNRWRVFGTILALAVPLGLAGTAIEGAGHALGGAPAILAQLLASILIAPIPPLAATTLYFELGSGSPLATRPGPPEGVPSQTLTPHASQDAAPTSPRA